MGELYIFESERLGFRRWKDDDREGFAEMNANPEVMEFFPDTLTKDESDKLIERFEQHTEEKGFGIWAVERKEDGAFIGFIGLLEVGFDAGFPGAVEIGWRLDNKFWKRGYAAEGAKATLDYAFKILDMNEICSFTAQTNKPSEMVMQRIGMTKAGEFDHPKLEKGSPLKKHVLYRITTGEYAAL
ncbi:GNAT family N-acetyltransferase [Planococcus beigongshangi]|uniref:GNAT family N-acetyltransferase n=1 Tax=Planococcus beigongshangi TaxID=2782536 RepID=UPI00193C4A45|nr:GNAT family N-acetyltransferase [Planococcus beigongshangi]